MKVLRILLVPLMATALVAACADDPTGEDEDPFDAFVGSWTATAFTYTADQGDGVFDLVAIYHDDAFNVTIADDGGFQATVRLPNPQDPVGGDPVDIQLTGVLTVQGAGLLHIDFDVASEDYFQDRTVSYSFESDSQLVWTDDSAAFDFDQDGEDEDADLNVVLER